MSLDRTDHHDLDEQRLREEERQALEEDHTRYDGIMPGFSRETRENKPGSEPIAIDTQGAGGLSGETASTRHASGSGEQPNYRLSVGQSDGRNSQTERDSDVRMNSRRDEVRAPQGYDRWLCINNLPSQLSSQAGRPADVEDRAAEYAVVESLNKTTKQRVAWLWPGRIPLGKLTMLVGDPDVGKSLLTLDLAARVTRGLPMPDRPNSPSPRGHVVLLTSEDTSDDTLVPRLEAAGADLSLVKRMHSISGKGYRSGGECTVWNRPIALPDDIQALESILLPYFNVPEQVREYRDGKFVPPVRWTNPCAHQFPPVRLVILDTLASFLPRTNSTDNVHVRRLLQPLVELAERYRVAIVAINHLNKSSQQAGQYRPMGSLAFTAVSRAVWGLVRDPQNRERRLFLPVKLNLGPTPTGLAFRTEGMKIVWEETPVTDNWAAVLSESKKCQGHEQREVAAFLKELLADGPILVPEVTAEVKRAGHSMTTARRARPGLGIDTYSHTIAGVRVYCWALPEHAEQPPILYPARLEKRAKGSGVRDQASAVFPDSCPLTPDS